MQLHKVFPMATIKRVEVTFNEEETDLLNFLENHHMANATCLKFALRELMNGNKIDYNKIKDLMAEVLNEYQLTPINKNVSSQQQRKKHNSLLDGLVKKY